MVQGITTLMTFVWMELRYRWVKIELYFIKLLWRIFLWGGRYTHGRLRRFLNTGGVISALLACRLQDRADQLLDDICLFADTEK